MKFFEAFSGSPRLAIMADTLTRAFVDLFHFCIVFGTIFITFALGLPHAVDLNFLKTGILDLAKHREDADLERSTRSYVKVRKDTAQYAGLRQKPFTFQMARSFSQSRLVFRRRLALVQNCDFFGRLGFSSLELESPTGHLLKKKSRTGLSGHIISSPSTSRCTESFNKFLTT
eukprot:5991461-Amphidinium_carterae.1